MSTRLNFQEDAKTEDVDDMTEELDGEVVMVNQVEVAKKKNAPADEKKRNHYGFRRKEFI